MKTGGGERTTHPLPPFTFPFPPNRQKNTSDQVQRKKEKEEKRRKRRGKKGRKKKKKR
jgi:hypothetical protein